MRWAEETEAARRGFVAAHVSDEDSWDEDRQVHDPRWLNRARERTKEERIAQLIKTITKAESELSRLLDQQCDDERRQSTATATTSR
jgi:hypothetical protein